MENQSEMSEIVVYYESIKRELKIRFIYRCLKLYLKDQTQTRGPDTVEYTATESLTSTKTTDFLMRRSRCTIRHFLKTDLVKTEDKPLTLPTNLNKQVPTEHTHKKVQEKYHIKSM